MKRLPKALPAPKPPSPYELARDAVLGAAKACVSVWQELVALGDDSMTVDTVEGKLLRAMEIYLEKEKFHQAAVTAWDTRRTNRAKQRERMKARQASLKARLKKGNKPGAPLPRKREPK